MKEETEFQLHDEQNTGNDPLQRLIRDLQEKDRDDTKALRILTVVFAMFVVIYLGAMTRQSGLMREGYAIMTGGFLLSMLFFLFRLRNRSRIDYSAPVIQFLRCAERRHAFLNWQEWIVSVPLILMMGTGGGIVVYTSMEKYFPGSSVPLVIYGIVLLTATLIGYFAGWSRWKRHKQEIYKRIRAMREEFGG